jgi:uncharacterized protein
MSADHPNVELAAKLFRAVEEADLEALGELYAADAVLTNNLGPDTMGPAEVKALVAGLIEKIPDYSYGEVRSEPTPSGFVRRHVLSGTSPAGERFAVAACCVAEVVDGRVRRLDEYLDSAGLAKLGL